MFLLSLALRARRNKVVTGSEGMIGETGTAVTPLAPEGKIFVRGEYWNAVAPRAVAAGGARARHCHRQAQTHGGTCSPAERSLNMIDFTSFTTIVDHDRGAVPDFLHQDPARVRARRHLPAGPPAGAAQRARASFWSSRPIDRIVRVSLRIDTLEVPAQDVITRDNVTVKVNAVIYFRVIEPRLAVVEVSNFLYATSQLAQTTLRSVLGEVELDELLSQREKLNLRLQSILDQHTSPWGVKVTMVEVKQVDLPEQMIRAIGRQAEAERERRAKIIHAEGEYSAAEKLAMAAKVIQEQPVAIQLRYLQTLVEIGTEKNTTIVFPLPLDILSSLERALGKLGEPSKPANSMKNSETGEFELVLGNKQLLSGFFLVVILFAVFFVMGYIVGRNSTPSSQLAATHQERAARRQPIARSRLRGRLPRRENPPSAAVAEHAQRRAGADSPVTEPQPTTQPASQPRRRLTLPRQPWPRQPSRLPERLICR